MHGSGERELKVFLYCGCAEMSLGEGLELLLDSEPRDESIMKCMTLHSVLRVGLKKLTNTWIYTSTYAFEIASKHRGREMDIGS